MICDNKVSQYVPKGWDYVEVTLKCGNTSIHGTPLYCEQCEAKFAHRGYAAHECRHGRDMSHEGAFCGACEFGDE
jgi:hypothetical protein